MTSAVASAIRPGLRDLRQPSSSPHTPPRFISSNYSSPGSTFRQEEDAVIFELQPRHLLAGFEGESGPQCIIPFGPQHDGRVGDYRRFAPGFFQPAENYTSWAHEYELWRGDLKDFDLRLLEDKLERYVREAYNNYLLTDAGTAPLVLVLPSLVPHPVLSAILSTLFERWSFPSITLLPSPTMVAVAGGVRSALVIDIGWEETVITPIYEYRELAAHRSTRAMRYLGLKMEILLNRARQSSPYAKSLIPVNFEFIQEVVHRAAFIGNVGIDNSAESRRESESQSTNADNAISADPYSLVSMIEIEWPTKRSSRPVKLSGHSVIKCVRSALADTEKPRHQTDDHEMSVPDLLYQALLALPTDIRATCIARVVFQGAGSQIPGLKKMILKSVEGLALKYGWTAVRGEKVESGGKIVAELAQRRTSRPSARHATPITPHEKDYPEQKLQKQREKEAQPYLEGELRQLESLGSWAGASLVTSLKVKGFVEIEREKFLSHGLSGAHRDVDISVVPQRMSGFALGARAQERNNWTLGGWG